MKLSRLDEELRPEWGKEVKRPFPLTKMEYEEEHYQYNIWAKESDEFFRAAIVAVMIILFVIGMLKFLP